MIALFVVGLSLGGLSSASALWLASGMLRPLPVPIRVGTMLIICMIAILRDLELVKIPLPENARQIPRSVFRRGIGQAAVHFGFELGTGVRTYVPTTIPYVLGVALLLLAPPYAIAIAAGTGFALGRAAYLLLRLGSGEDSAWDSAFERWGRWVSPIGLLAAGSSLYIHLLA